MADLLSGFSSRSSFTFSSLLGAFFGVVLAAMLGMLCVLFSLLAFFSCCGSCGFRSGGSCNSRCGGSSRRCRCCDFLCEGRSGSAHQSDCGKSCEQTTRNHFLNLQYNRPEFLEFYCTIPCKKHQPVSDYMHNTA